MDWREMWDHLRAWFWAAVAAAVVGGVLWGLSEAWGRLAA
jgi:hypothetical protein